MSLEQLGEVEDTGYAVFTGCVIKGLKGGEAADEQGDVTVRSLYEYLYARVTTLTEGKQTPKLIDYGSAGNLILAKNPHPPLPKYLLDRLASDSHSDLINAVYDLKAQIDSGSEYAKAAREALWETYRHDRDIGVHDAARHCLQDIGELHSEPKKSVEAQKLALITPAKKNAAYLILVIALLVALFGGGIVYYWKNQPVFPPENGESEKLAAQRQAEEKVKQALAAIDKQDLGRAKNLLSEATKLDAGTKGLKEAQGRLEEARKAEALKHATEERQRKERTKREKIKLLLVSAEKNIAANRLTLPSDRNALDDYQAVLQLEPENVEAVSGIKKIAERYVAMAQDDIKEGELAKAEQMLDKASSIDPEGREMVSLRKEIFSRKSRAKSYIERAMASIEKKDLVSAEKKIEKAVALDKGISGLDEARNKLTAARAEVAASTKSRKSGEIFHDNLNIKQKQEWRDPVTGMAFAWVPEGCFQMGSNEGHSDEKPVHEVCVDGFWMGKYEVTQGQWKKIMGNNPSYFKKGVNHPVEKVSWNDVQGFINKLNSKGQGGFRLPTEAEWEYACRSGGKQEKYCGGDDVDRVAWYDNNSGNKTHPVGKNSANGLGLYDMSGNVLEWVSDWYDRNYYRNSPKNNPQGPSSGSNRVIRGGSWSLDADYCRSAFRISDDPGFRDGDVGFRYKFRVLNGWYYKAQRQAGEPGG